MPEPDSFTAEMCAVVTATATHPAGVVLDEAGNPVLDGDGQPIFEETP